MKIIIVIIGVFLNHTLGHSQNCELIAKYGTYDTRTLNYSKERAISYLDLFRRDTKMTYQEAQNYTASLGIPIGDVLVQLGFSANEESYKTFIESLFSMKQYNEYYLEAVKSVNHTVNKDIIEVLKDCFTQPGIYGWLESTSDKDINFIVLKFLWPVNHNPIKLKLTYDADSKLFNINGEKPKKNFRIVLNNGEERRYSIKRSANIAIPFTLNLENNNAFALFADTIYSFSDVVPIHSGSFTFYKTQESSTSDSDLVLIKVEKPEDLLLDKSTSIFAGGGDEELKRFSSTWLHGSFSIDIKDDRILGILDATIKEEQDNWTTFSNKRTYTIFKAPEGYKIISYKPISGESTYTSLNFQQRGWSQSESNLGGPISSIDWQGDSGNDHDQIDGTWIIPRLKSFIVILQRK